MEETAITIKNDCLSDPKMNPYTLKEELGYGLSRDILLVGCWNGHFREPIKNHKNAVIAMLCGW